MHKLSEEFATSARLYSELVSLLSVTSKATKSELAELWQRAEDARDRAEQAGIAFEEHIESHNKDRERRAAAQA